MEISLDWLDDFYQTSYDIIGDVILLEALALRMDPGHQDSAMVRASQRHLDETACRLLNYLSQHTEELALLNRRLEQM